VDRQTFCIILLLCTLDIAPPPPAATVSGDKNVNMSDIAPCLAAVHKCNNVGWDFCLARQHGSASALSPKTFIFSTLQNSPVDCSNGLLCAPSCCTFKQLLTSQHQHFQLSVIRCSDNCVGNLNNSRAFRGDIMDVQSLSEEHNLIVEIYLSWLLFYW